MTQQLGLFPETQADRVLQMLKGSVMGVCAVEFLQARIPRFGGRIYDLRREGHDIIKRRCFATSHRHQSRQVRYVLIPPRIHRLSPSE